MSFKRKMNDMLALKTLLFSLFFTAFTHLQAQPTSNPSAANWLFDFETAKKAAIEQKAPILLSFSGSDWCIPCMRLEKELFADSAFIQYANQSLVLLKADFPSKKKNTLSPEQIQHNEVLAEQYNPKGTFPLVVILDATGTVRGYLLNPMVSAEKYLEEIRDMVE
jgi:thioredoxin-related protein